MEVSIIITIFALIMALFYKHSKYTSLLLLSLIFAVCIYEVGPNYSDYAEYQRLYNQIGHVNSYVYTYEFLFVLIFKIGHLFHLSFDGLRVIVAFFECMLIYSTVKRYTKNTSLVLALFFIYPIILAAELFRQLIGLSIIIYGIRYIIDGKSMKDNIKYLLFVFLASLFHSSCWFYLVFLILRFKKVYNMKLKNLLFFVFAFVFFGYFVARSGILFKCFSLLPIRDFTIEKYETNIFSNFMGILYALLKQLFINIIPIGAFYFFMRRKSNRSLNSSQLMNKSNDVYNYNFYNIILKINIVSDLILIPLYYSTTVQRLNHVIIFLNYVFMADIVSKLSFRKYRFFLILISLLYAITFLFFAFLFEGSGTLEVFLRNFSDGYLVHMFRNILG